MSEALGFAASFTMVPLLLLPFAVCALIGYLLGSVNSAIIVTRLFRPNEDIRTLGSGNAGMTNVLRSVGKLPAVLTFVGDFLKCVIACLLAWGLIALVGYPGTVFVQIGKFIAGAFCVLGHMFPLYYGFQGGKGIVCSSALMLMTDWRVFLLILATFGLIFLIKRIISLASVCCAILYPVYTFCSVFFLEYTGGEGTASLGYLLFATLVSLLLSALVLWKHRANIGRLLRGEEQPIKAKRK